MVNGPKVCVVMFTTSVNHIPCMCRSPSGLVIIIIIIIIIVVIPSNLVWASLAVIDDGVDFVREFKSHRRECVRIYSLK